MESKMNVMKEVNQESKFLINEISHLIEKAKVHVAREYNVTQLILNWMIGNRINDEILKSQRAEYGEQIVTEIAKILTLKYGAGYSRPNLFRMIKFAKLFPKKEIISTMSRQLSWSHFVLIGGMDDQIKRDSGDFVMLTKRINGGTIGIEDRKHHFEIAMHYLQG